MEVQYKLEDRSVESLWGKVREESSRGRVMVGTCYRPPKQDEGVDEAFFKKLMKASKLQDWLLWGT